MADIETIRGRLNQRSMTPAAREDVSALLAEIDNLRDRVEWAESVRDEHYARLRQYEKYVEDLEGAFIHFKTSLRNPPPDPIASVEAP